MKPKISYRVWMSQRNGSTLLCKALEETGIAGIPNEWFNISTNSCMCETYGCSTYEELTQKLWSLGSSENGVFAVKHSLFKQRFIQIQNELKKLKGEVKSDNSSYELWNDWFPNCHHIFLSRRNKVRQAVSWWKAIKDDAWHIKSGMTHKNPQQFYDDNYDFNALMRLWKETVLRECAIQEWFAQNDIVPLSFYYEDFVKDINGTVQQIIDYLEIDYDEIQFPKPYFTKIADDYSEQWVQRFRKDLQKGWEHECW